MILRRVIEHVKNQHWTAVWIDLIIVILGVFIGTQVSNWNADWETSKKAAIFSERLKADLRLEAWGYEGLIEYYKDVSLNADRTLAAIDGELPLSDEQFVISAYRATQYKYNDRYRATYDEMVSTGNIGLIKDEKLRNVSVRAYSLSTIDNLVKEGIESRYRELFRMSVPNDVQRALGKACGDRYIKPGDYQNFDHVNDYPCKTTLPADVIDDAANALRSDPQTIRYLRQRIADLDTRLVDMTQNNRDVWEALLVIAKEKP